EGRRKCGARWFRRRGRPPRGGRGRARRPALARSDGAGGHNPEMPCIRLAERRTSATLREPTLAHLKLLSHASKSFLCFSTVFCGPTKRMKYGPFGFSKTTPIRRKSGFSVTLAFGSNGGKRDKNVPCT